MRVQPPATLNNSLLMSACKGMKIYKETSEPWISLSSLKEGWLMILQLQL